MLATADQRDRQLPEKANRHIAVTHILAGCGCIWWTSKVKCITRFYRYSLQGVQKISPCRITSKPYCSMAKKDTILFSSYWSV